PSRTREAGGRCPECGKPLTVGVLSRVEDLADRPEGYVPPNAAEVIHLVPLAEILGEINGVGVKLKTVEGELNKLIAGLGPELEILTTTPIEDISRVGGELLAEAIGRLRRGEVRRVAGYDGEYGVITLFEPGELDRNSGGGPQADALFDVPVPRQRPAAEQAGRRGAGSGGAGDAMGGADGSTKRSGASGRAGDARKRAGASKDTSSAGAAPADGKPTRRRSGRATAPPEPPIPPPASPHEPFEPMLAGMEEVGTGLLDRLD